MGDIFMKNFKVIPISNENITRYKVQMDGLIHVRTTPDTRGVMLIDKDKIAGYIQCDMNTNTIIALEVAYEYRRTGVATGLIRMAETKFGCNKLSVRKTNKEAYTLYNKLGYNITHSDDHMHYMSK